VILEHFGQKKSILVILSHFLAIFEHFRDIFAKPPCTTLIINKLKQHTSEVFAQRNTADQANLQLLQPSSTSTQPWYLRQGECILCMEPLLPGSTFGFRCGHFCMCSCYQQDPRSIQDGSAKRNCQVPGCYAQCEKICQNLIFEMMIFNRKCVSENEQGSDNFFTLCHGGGLYPSRLFIYGYTDPVNHPSDDED